MLTLYLSDQPFWLALYSLAIGAWVLRNWLLLHHPEARGRLAIWPLLGRMALIGLPWALVLFVLFPRLEHPLWRLPQAAPASRTGMSDVMRPGSVGQLVRSPEVALRAEIEGDALPAGALYWRAWCCGSSTARAGCRRATPAVHDAGPSAASWHSAGRQRGLHRHAGAKPATLAVHAGPWRGDGIERQYADLGGWRVFRGGASGAAHPLPCPLHAGTIARAAVGAHAGIGSEPAPGNPRARELAAEWAARYADPVQRVQAALRLFGSRRSATRCGRHRWARSRSTVSCSRPSADSASTMRAASSS
ncbi:hypothetical protein AWV80_12115 [Cupriavidus sp. UYMU48A]|nr:hypothetical protein AWV80_12115 [Cupriavidus sp. UYMU48A]